MSAEAKQGLQTEVVACKTRWTDQLKMSKAPAGAPNAPLPLAVARTIPRPDGPVSAYDVEEIVVRLWIDSLAGSEGGVAPVRVEVAGKFPEVLQRHIADHVEARWRLELGARGAGNGWLLEKMLSWVEGAYEELLNLEPSLVECYEGCDDNGMTIRRYAIAEPPPPPSPKDSDEESEDEESDDEALAAATSGLSVDQERELRIKMKAEAEADRVWREQQRAEHEALGDERSRQPQKLSKKEMDKMAEEKKKNKGARLSKTGSKAHKPVRDDKEKKDKTNKKNGLMH